jgi:CAAX protease family protein
MGLRRNAALASFAALLLGIGLEVHLHPAVAAGLSSHLPYALASFALLLAPLWFFGFGAGEWLRDRARSSGLRIFLPALLGVPYLVSAIPAHDVRWAIAVPMFALPVTLAAFLELPALPAKMVGRDVVVLAVLALTYMLRLLAAAWPYPGLAAFPKLFVVDLALYLYVVVRRLAGVGYRFLPGGDAVARGLKEWLYFLPCGIGLGWATHFIHFHLRLPSATEVSAELLVTFLLVAIPEELFFRGILQNLLETRCGRRPALLLTAVLFGLAHFNKGATFNWRYVLLAAVAGFFYGRAWRARRQLLASVLTHTAVDVVWSLWFR